MASTHRVGTVFAAALVAGALGWTCLASAAPAPPADGAAPLPSDPALVRGELPNGLHYVVRRHDVPPGRAVMWIHLHTGSLNETERQRGIAHYLEHMAFNGSRNFPPGSLVPFFESMGMTFGRDQNAFTSFDQTTYQLSLPKADAETLGSGMTFFADVLTELSLLPGEIDAERQIIQEERRRGLSGQQRVNDIVMERMTPGSIFGVRQPIGTEQSIDGLAEEDFRAYYGNWYVPSNATLIVVADADPAMVVKVIEERFGSAPTRPRPTPQAANVTAYDRSFAIVASDPEVRGESLRITRIEPAHPPTTTAAQYRDDLIVGLGTAAFNRRLGEKVARGGTSYLSARASAGNEVGALYTAEISARPAPGAWKAALDEVALELQRARTFGFSERELEQVGKGLVAGAERAVDTEATVPASSLISRINNDLASGEPTLSPQQRLDLLRTFLPTITAEEVGSRFARAFDPTAVAFIAVMREGDGAAVPTESELLAVGTAALKVVPEPEVELAHATELLAEPPVPGAVAEGGMHAGSAVWSGWLDNNIRVHHRFMDERRNAATVQIALIGGPLLEDASNHGITQAAQLAFSRPATRHLSSTDIRDLMTGRKVAVGGAGGFRGGRGGRGRGGSGGGDSISLSISGSPDEFETGFQLAYLLLTEPLIESAGFDQYLTSTREALAESVKSPMSLGARCVAEAMYPPDEPRTRPLEIAELDRIELGQAQAWLDRLVRESPIEVSIVGDIDRDQALDLVARYLGALPTRPRIDPTTYESLRHLQRPDGPRVVQRTLETPTEQAFVFVGFYGPDQTDRAAARAMAMAARILSMRMVKEVREEAQLVYSIGASSRAGSTYPGFGVFSASAPTEPAKADALVAKLQSMYTTFAESGPSEDEMETAKKQVANTFSEQVRQPSYWLGRLNEMTFRGVTLDEILSEPDAYQAVTAAEVRETFRQFYTSQDPIVVVVRPDDSSSTE
ncbi:MAG: insulinase family protein [Phycisphaerales bacterium]|nr:insulinase family protein [Phycisphaerales bacterium]